MNKITLRLFINCLLFFVSFLFINVNCNAQSLYWKWAQQEIMGDWSPGRDVATDINNNVYVCGYFSDTAKFGNISVSGGSNTGYTVKYDSLGNVQWVDVFPTLLSGWVNCWPEKIITDNQNNVYISGNYRGGIIAGSYTLTGDNVFLIKIGPTGNIIWAKQSNNSGGITEYSMSIDGNNNIYLAGICGSGTHFGNLVASKDGLFIVKYNSSGVPINLINEYGCIPFSININQNNKIFVTAELVDTTVIGNDTLIPSGYYSYYVIDTITDSIYNQMADFLFICYNANGNVVWDRVGKTIGYIDRTFSTLDDYSNFYIAGDIEDTTDFWGTNLFYQFPVAGYNTSFVMKIDSLGNINWLKYSQPVSTYGRIILRDLMYRQGYVYIVGFPWGKSYFANMTINSISPDANTIILKLDSAGNGIMQIFDSTSLGRNDPNAITMNRDNNIIITGFFEDTIHFGNQYLYEHGSGSLTMFVAETQQTLLLGNEYPSITNNGNFILFPNPLSTYTTFQTDNLLKNATLVIYNSYGQQVKQIKNISGNSITLYRDNLPSGLYFLRLTQGNIVITTDKLVIID
jgi:hypothetical protein